MNIGVKANENRIAMVPSGTGILVKHGHTVFIEKDGDAAGTSAAEIAELAS